MYVYKAANGTVKRSQVRNQAGRLGRPSRARGERIRKILHFHYVLYCLAQKRRADRSKQELQLMLQHMDISH